MKKLDNKEYAQLWEENWDNSKQAVFKLETLQEYAGDMTGKAWDTFKNGDAKKLALLGKEFAKDEEKYFAKTT